MAVGALPDAEFLGRSALTWIIEPALIHGFEPFGLSRMAPVHVIAFARVVLEIEQDSTAVPNVHDQLEAGSDNSALHIIKKLHNLGYYGNKVSVPRQKRQAMGALTRQYFQRSTQPAQANRFVTNAGWTPRYIDNQWDVDAGLVEVRPVSLCSVLTQIFAMIRTHGDHRVGKEPTGLQVL